LSFVFRKAQSDQSAGESSDRSHGANTRQRSHDRTGGDNRPETRDCERANPGQPSEHAADNRAYSGSRNTRLRSFGALVVHEILTPVAVRVEDRNVGGAKAIHSERADCILRQRPERIDPEYRRVPAHEAVEARTLPFVNCLKYRDLPPG